MNRQQRRAARHGRNPADPLLAAVEEAVPTFASWIEDAEVEGDDRDHLIALIVHPSHPTAPTLAALDAVGTRHEGVALPRLRDGSRVMVAPKEAVLALARSIDARLAAQITRPPTNAGEVWCVVLHRASALAIPFGWSSTPPVPPNLTHVGAVFAQWPETAHLAAMLPGERFLNPEGNEEIGHSTGELLRAFDAFLAIFDGLPAPPAAMQETARKVRVMIPELRRIERERPTGRRDHGAN